MILGIIFTQMLRRSIFESLPDRDAGSVFGSHFPDKLPMPLGLTNSKILLPLLFSHSTDVFSFARKICIFPDTRCFRSFLILITTLWCLFDVIVQTRV